MNKFVALLTYILAGPYIKARFIKEIRGKENFLEEILF